MGDHVLIVGAGPTGLTLAAQVHAHGGRVRVIERRQQPQRSRAFIMHPRTLELLAPLGVVDALRARGDASATATLRAAGRSATVTLARSQIGGTAFPYLLAIPQAAVEEVLQEYLREVGVRVERGVELVSLRAGEQTVDCVLRGPAGEQSTASARYVVGCDGADSTVRKSAGIPFWRRDYRATVLMANLHAQGQLTPAAINAYLGARGLMFLIPSREAADWRLLAVGVGVDRQGGHARQAPDPDVPMLQAVADEFTGGHVQLRDLAWATHIPLRRGQARRYRTGRVLVAGDAAHLNSPAGAQGMNTGIQDACNLGWKLALVATGRAAPRLLDSYQAERWPVARCVRHLTDLVFLGEAGGGVPIRLLRRYAVPMALPMISGRTLPAWAFRFLGGLLIGYRRSPAATDDGPARRRTVRAGDRLPDGPVVSNGDTIWLHQAMSSVGFHLLLCGPAHAFDDTSVLALQQRVDVPVAVHRLTRTAGPGVLADPHGSLLDRLGGGAPAVYLVRPDRYVGYRGAGTSAAGAIHYLRSTLALTGGSGQQPQ